MYRVGVATGDMLVRSSIAGKPSAITLDDAIGIAKVSAERLDSFIASMDEGPSASAEAQRVTSLLPDKLQWKSPVSEPGMAKNERPSLVRPVCHSS